MKHVIFVKPFLYDDEEYSIKVDSGIGFMDGFLSDNLADELIDLGVAVEIQGDEE